MSEPNFIAVINDGPDIKSSNYWENELAANGIIFCSVNGGAIRVCLPPDLYRWVPDIQTATEVVLSRGPWPAMGQAEAVEILYDDGSDSPYVMFLGRSSFAEGLPAKPPPGRKWNLSVWVKEDGLIRKVLDSACYWRTVPSIPCLKAWRERV